MCLNVQIVTFFCDAGWAHVHDGEPDGAHGNGWSALPKALWRGMACFYSACMHEYAYICADMAATRYYKLFGGLCVYVCASWRSRKRLMCIISSSSQSCDVCARTCAMCMCVYVGMHDGEPYGANKKKLKRMHICMCLCVYIFVCFCVRA